MSLDTQNQGILSNRSNSRHGADTVEKRKPKSQFVNNDNADASEVTPSIQEDYMEPSQEGAVENQNIVLSGQVKGDDKGVLTEQNASPEMGSE